ncbi:MAG TPA: GNAT family N-acetyltransferase [Candidatus Binataceae bacterium]|nr:GNAT family N-acetyltransferase [Candidatus Binataceae bacterium]
MDFRRMTRDDLPAILRIQSASFVGNLTPEQRAGGFLSAEYTAEEISRMADDVAVLVAAEDGRVLAFVCAYSTALGAQFPIVTRMAAQFGEIDFRGRRLADWRVLVYGPICVDPAARGRGTVRGLFEQLKREGAGRFDVGTALVAEDNPHSMRVHVTRLGMTPVGEFDYRGKRFTILAFAL